MAGPCGDNSPGVNGHLIGLAGDWSLWRDFAVRSAGFPVDGLEVFGGEGESAGLAEVAVDPAFAEAVIWQNRSAYRTAVAKIAGAGAGSGSKRRQREGVVAGYWQRYCAKNDTVGFFGPLAWGEVCDHGPAVDVRSGALVASREVHFESWCLEALAHAAGTDAVVPLRDRARHQRIPVGLVVNRLAGFPVALISLTQVGLVEGSDQKADTGRAMENHPSACAAPSGCRAGGIIRH
jgi:Lantibiotic dehydratase, N terminus